MDTIHLFKNLKILKLGHIEIYHDAYEICGLEDISALRKLPQLEELFLHCNTNISFQPLADCKKLKRLSLNTHLNEPNTDINFSSLIDLSIESIKISVVGDGINIDSIEQLSTLRTLKIRQYSNHIENLKDVVFKVIFNNNLFKLSINELDIESPRQMFLFKKWYVKSPLTFQGRR